MNLQEKLAQEIKAAMIARDAERLGPLRLLKSALGYAQIDGQVDSIPDAEFVALTQKEIKKRRDSVEQFENGGRRELADKEKREIAVLETFLPQPLSAGDLEQLIRGVIQELGASSKKSMGPVIKAVQGKAAGRADGKTISSAVAKLLP